MKNGIYKSENATFFVKDGKVMMNLKGTYYQTNENFMLGVSYDKPLTDKMERSFDNCYEKCNKW